MINISTKGSYDQAAIHLNKADEINTLNLLPSLIGVELLVIEDPTDGFKKKKVTTASIAGATTDSNAIHKHIPSEIIGIDEKLIADNDDVLLIEDTHDSNNKKRIKISAITIDNIGDGSTYVKMLSTERSKLSDITSSGIDIADAVTKKHTQGTDTTLGIQIANSDWGTKKITNAGEPDNPQDYATKNYVDTHGGGGTDVNAVHLISVISEIATLDQCLSIDNNLLLLLEDITTHQKYKFNVSSITIDDISDGVLFKKMTDIERTKISGIADGADVTADAEPLLSVNTHSDITSTGDLIEDAVSLRHTQGTDTALGIMAQNINLNNLYKIENAINPTEDQDYATKKYVDDAIGGNDPNAIHKDIAGEIALIDAKLIPESGDFILIEDVQTIPSPQWQKKKISISSISLDIISDGITYKRLSDTEKIKLSGISEGADVTADAEPFLSVNTHSDITSTGDLIENAVSLRHTQGTDTALGIQAINSDWGTNRITNAGDPIDPQDYVTKSYADSIKLNTTYESLFLGVNNPTVTNPIINNNYVDNNYSTYISINYTNDCIFLDDGSTLFSYLTGSGSTPCLGLRNINSRNTVSTIFSVINPIKQLLSINRNNHIFYLLEAQSPDQSLLIYNLSLDSDTITYDQFFIEDVLGYQLFLHATDSNICLIGASNNVNPSKIYRFDCSGNVQSLIYVANDPQSIYSFCNLNNSIILIVVTSPTDSKILVSVYPYNTISVYSLLTHTLINNIINVGNNTILINSYNNIYKSIDGGLTFASESIFNVPIGSYITKVIYIGMNTVVVLVDDGISTQKTIKISYDMGETWGNLSTTNILIPIQTIEFNPITQKLYLCVGDINQNNGGIISYPIINKELNYKSIFVPCDYDVNLGYRRAQGVSATGAQRFSFAIPKDFKSWGRKGGFEFLFFPAALAAHSNVELILALECDWGAGTDRQTILIEYISYIIDLSLYNNKLYSFTIHDLWNPFPAGCTYGIMLGNNSIGGTIYYVGTNINYIGE
jgi:hypothetical protein